MTEPLIQGNESLEELRSKIRDISYACPYGQSHDKCPFKIFGLLSVPARNGLIMGMSRETCLHLFELEYKCRMSNNCPRADKA